jgi:chitin disaccharide deacetylase
MEGPGAEPGLSVFGEKIMPTGRTNELLGYPADARLLIINADDFGRFQSINDAILRTMTEGVVRSTTLMVPCQGAHAAMQALAENSDLAFGVHLTLIAEPATNRWGPVASKDQVPSLVDENGEIYNYEQIPKLLELAKLNELEMEFRAQIEHVLTAGLKPTHLDFHCLFDAGRPDIFDMTVGLAKEYGLALRVGGRDVANALQAEGLPTNDHVFLDSYRLGDVGKSARFVQLLRDLPPGLSEWAAHPGLDTPESQELDSEGWTIRFADFEFLISQEAKDTIREEGIILLDYRPLQKIWSAG